MEDTLGELVRRSVRSRSAPGLAWACGVAAIGLLCAARGHAQVLEIDDQGAVRRFDGPTQFLGDGPPVPLQAASRAERHRMGSDRTPTAPVKRLLEDAAQRSQISPDLLTAVARRESGLNPQARSAKGALGVMQLMPGTAKDLAVDPLDPAANVDGGTRYLKTLLARYDGDVIKALAAYNAGMGAVDRHGGVPPFPETKAYVDAILEHMAQAVAPRRKP
ncbi:lytic transglycosylase domain-containing protein [Caulobacter vibrioides]|uniref:Transglycosylase, putative n=2 Tax=Caulobacter vibrioides TaxID=155892 RepID=Q9A5N1_CAUVC|nr:lytic transglycosylase domain-containing protein [Caulobacter vibrioides]YP_002517871.1 soluble lytic transglycosylase SdpC [Caulobacter vibrioides NA1000]AAK24387.1 transglycosylase, putative [Caulobacter vibrioides CB15]ACL95963.1 soluble lytic transglycosylase SdpC [Caulobacter vibrioides NA1000]ATC25408.1 lytic transglycosylase domain-containing protein [Caulobacter vibrioides]ATC29270.1 lytic transglycosylase domain-containing protein [Caulobacter vibrioides]AZH13500.1 lytic transglyc